MCFSRVIFMQQMSYFSEFWLLSIVHLIQYQQPMKYVMEWLTICCLLQLASSAQTCTTAADCTLAPNYSFCNDQAFCQCQNGYIFNCSISAGSLFSGSTTLSLPSQSQFYYVLSNITDQKIEYLITLTDNTQHGMLYNYSLNFFIDQGVGMPADIPTGTLQDGGSQLKIDIELVLGSMPGTAIPQSLVMMISNNQRVEGVVFVNYNFSWVGNSSTLLIVAYVGGAVCLCVTLVLMIVLYRKRTAERPRRRRQQQQQNDVIDISHFDNLMPIAQIPPHLKREGKVCSVCLQEFDINATIRTTVCAHIFHSQCLDQWCIKNLICPMCRTDLSPVNILLLRSQNSKKDNQSSWIMNSIDQEEDPQKQAGYPQPNSNRLNQPFLPDTASPSIGNQQL